jgi:hypothetical protein
MKRVPVKGLHFNAYLPVSATALGVGLVGPSRVRPRVRAEKFHLGRSLTIRVYAISLENQTGR